MLDFLQIFSAISSKWFHFCFHFSLIPYFEACVGKIVYAASFWGTWLGRMVVDDTFDDDCDCEDGDGDGEGDC